MMPRTLSTLICSTLLILATASPAEAQPAARPNIIFLLTDDMGPGDLGCCGGTVAPTPNIDRLAKEGTRFTQFYVAAPICSPSRAGLITGQYPGRWRITSFLQTKAGNGGCEQADFLDPKAPALPRALKAAGYATAHFGKWHLGGGRDVKDAPKFAEYGYDEHAGTYESPEPDPDITATDWIWSDKDKVKRWERSGFFIDKTLDFVKRNRAANRPSFVNLWIDDPHTPWVPKADAPKAANPANLRGVLTEVDRQVGRLMDGLRELGVEENTLLIFASDNGPLPTFKGGRSAGMRGAKLSLYEAGIRTPMIIRWPGKTPAGRVDDQSVISALDFFPTLCAIAGAKPPDGVALDGQDITPVLTGAATIKRAAPLFWEYGRNEKFFAYPPIATDRSPNLAVRDGRWKLLVNADGSGAELYDIEHDLAEKDNVISKNPEVAKDLTQRVLAWRKALP